MLLEPHDVFCLFKTVNYTWVSVNGCILYSLVPARTSPLYIVITIPRTSLSSIVLCSLALRRVWRIISFTRQEQAKALKNMSKSIIVIFLVASTFVLLCSCGDKFDKDDNRVDKGPERIEPKFRHKQVNKVWEKALRVSCNRNYSNNLQNCANSM